MTAAARTDHASVTDGDDVRVRVRAAGNGSVVLIRPDLNDSTAYTRAIPRSPNGVKEDKPSKIRDFVSQHAGEARTSLAGSWLGDEQPHSLKQVADNLLQLPGGFLPNTVAVAAGTFRLTVYALAYLLCFTVDTNKRAAVTFTLLLLSITAAWAISAYAG